MRSPEARRAGDGSHASGRAGRGALDVNVGGLGGVSVGGGSGGGVSVGGSVGGASVGGSVGGGGGVSAGASGGGGSASASVGGGSGASAGARCRRQLPPASVGGSGDAGGLCRRRRRWVEPGSAFRCRAAWTHDRNWRRNAERGQRPSALSRRACSRSTVQVLSEVDARKLKKTCKQILGSPQAFTRLRSSASARSSHRSDLPEATKKTGPARAPFNFLRCQTLEVHAAI